MKNIWKHSGTLLWITGVIHCTVGLIVGWEGHEAILRGGVVNALGEEFEPQLAFWFLVCGIAIILFGATLQHYIVATQRPAPKFLGWWMLILSALGCVIAPVTGFWLFLPQAWIILAANRSVKNKKS